MDIAIWGTKKEAIYLKQQLCNCSKYSVKFFLDNDIEKHNEYFDGIICRSLESMLQLGINIDAVLICVRGTQSRISIYKQLRELYNGKIAFTKMKFIVCEEQFRDSDLYWLESNKEVIPYLETNIVDGCNLKCKGCTHFAQLFTTKDFYSLENYNRDLAQLSDMCDVVQVRLLGGEPLMLENIEEYVIATRTIMPRADISIVTNGLLINKMTNRFFHVLKESDAYINISVYPPTQKKLDKIISLLQKQEVSFSLQWTEDKEMIDIFWANLSLRGDSNVMVSSKICHSSGCRFLRNGRLYKCPTEGLIDRFNEEYKTGLELSNGINIYDNKIDWSILLEQMNSNGVEMCKYCAETVREFGWEVANKPAKDDWLV